VKQQREVIFELNLPYRRHLRVERAVYQAAPGPRLAVAAGVHGDELEGLGVCHTLAAWLEDAEWRRPGTLRGRLELYPAINPLGMDAQHRELPLYDADLNRSFPGHADGLLPRRLAAAVSEALSGCTLVLALHASNVYIREHPQLRLHPQHAPQLQALAAAAGLEVIWTQVTPPVAEGSLAYSCNARGIPCLTLVGGIGMRCGTDTTQALAQAVLRLAVRVGVLDPSALPSSPMAAAAVGDRVEVLTAPASGVFLASAATGWVEADSLLATIVTPYSGEILAEVRSPVTGLLFSLREYPLVYQGSLIARIASKEGEQ
jgi:hypothetical protein